MIKKINHMTALAQNLSNLNIRLVSTHNSVTTTCWYNSKWNVFAYKTHLYVKDISTTTGLVH